MTRSDSTLQRKIFTFAELYLPRLGYARRAHFMNAMVPGLGGGKMSSSDPNSKIDFLDPPEVVRKKIRRAFCEEGNITENGVLAFVEAVLIPISEMRLERERDDVGAASQKLFITDDAPDGTVYTVARDPKHGGPMHFSSFQDIQTHFLEKKLHPTDLKTSVAESINKLLDPIRKAFEENEEWQAVEKLAYPDPNAKPEKKKKVRVASNLSRSEGIYCIS
jgi:tyrosyl-tRNA synthetase